MVGGLWPRRPPVDARDAGVFGGWGLDVFQLMLMMQGCLGGWGLDVLRLMFVMLGLWGLWPRRAPADADDAGVLGCRCLDVLHDAQMTSS